MDDYNPATLSEARNEYSIRLINILSPLVIEGLKSIYQEAWELCLSNDEKDKYLMTFQNFLTRVPKWNQDIIEGETKRVLSKSGCTYLEDLLACVHITQLKILTSIRVATKQKKIDIAVPKLADFIHKVYIACARKLYSSIYLFETGVEPLQRQKNMREAETICRECILNVIRDNMPVEEILRAYMDETVEEEVVMVESKAEEEAPKAVKAHAEQAEQAKKGEEVKPHATVTKKAETEPPAPADEDEPPPPKPAAVVIQTEPAALDAKKEEPPAPTASAESVAVATHVPRTAAGTAPTAAPDTPPAPTAATDTLPAPAAQPAAGATDATKVGGLQFNDKDTVLSYDGKEKVNQLEQREPEAVSAPKTVDRLEAISAARHAQRRAEEEEEEEEGGGAEANGDKIKIFANGPVLKTEALDVQDLTGPATVSEIPGVEVLY